MKVVLVNSAESAWTTAGVVLSSNHLTLLAEYLHHDEVDY